MRIWPGRPHPLGAHWDGSGTNFAVYSQHATGAEVCLFDPDRPGEETARVPLNERTDFVWHGYLPDVSPGQLYGFRLDGSYAPDQGYRFNAQKLLIDPYARAIAGELRWNDALFGFPADHPDADLARDDRDSAPFVPRSVVVNEAFPWEEDRPPRTPWNRTVIYECHVRGMTIRHPDVPEHLRGRYLGLASEPVIDHWLSLGVTAVELMPVHHSISERFLVGRGLSNYWGYNTLGFFAPDARFASACGGQQVDEFKGMVKALHAAGIEVILDVVYNHSAEGGHDGPTLSLRGLDNASYYRLVPGDPRRYADTTGCGNSLNAAHHRTHQLILDSLRYWVKEMHVDGFRFDLAPALARDLMEVGFFEHFFAIIQQDPILAGVKLIAEPWDLGPGGYRVGGFPSGWAEWNGAYRDTVRRFWRGEPGQLGELASRLSGSGDIFESRGRAPYASINFVTCHDGFTLRDLVSYERKHNEANGEENCDGSDANWSRNWGVEGETESVRIRRLRERMQRNFLATLAFSQGVPMLSHGDELGRTQQGNNNAYAQDNEISWIDWDLDGSARELLAFTRHVFALRAGNAAFRRRSFFTGGPHPGTESKDLSWLCPDGLELETQEWQDPQRQAVGMMVLGEATDDVDERGRPRAGETTLLLLNAGDRPFAFQLPEMPDPGLWRQVVNTSRAGTRLVRRRAVNLGAHTLMLLVYERRR